MTVRKAVLVWFGYVELVTYLHVRQATLKVFFADVDWQPVSELFSPHTATDLVLVECRG